MPSWWAFKSFSIFAIPNMAARNNTFRKPFRSYAGAVRVRCWTVHVLLSEQPVPAYCITSHVPAYSWLSPFLLLCPHTFQDSQLAVDQPAPPGSRGSRQLIHSGKQRMRWRCFLPGSVSWQHRFTCRVATRAHAFLFPSLHRAPSLCRSQASLETELTHHHVLEASLIPTAFC